MALPLFLSLSTYIQPAPQAPPLHRFQKKDGHRLVFWRLLMNPSLLLSASLCAHPTDADTETKPSCSVPLVVSRRTASGHTQVLTLLPPSPVPWNRESSAERSIGLIPNPKEQGLARGTVECETPTRPSSFQGSVDKGVRWAWSSEATSLPPPFCSWVGVQQAPPNLLHLFGLLLVSWAVVYLAVGLISRY